VLILRTAVEYQFGLAIYKIEKSIARARRPYITTVLYVTAVQYTSTRGAF
jgi:hypothetical protein